MSDAQLDMALAYLKTQPDAAAAVMERLPAAQVAEFLLNIPYRQASQILARMLPVHAARLCDHLSAQDAASLMSGMKTFRVAAVVRHMHRDNAVAVQGFLPERVRLAIRVMLGYSESVVGAWMLTDYPLATDDEQAEATLKRLASLGAGAELGTVFVVDRNGTLVGVVSLLKLLQSPGQASVSALMRASPESVSANASLGSLARSPIWRRYQSVAVVNSRRQLIGVLRHQDLREGLALQSRPSLSTSEGGAINTLWQAYGGSLAAMVDLVSDLSAPVQAPMKVTDKGGSR